MYIKREDAIKYCKSKADHYRKRLARIEAQGGAICYDPTEQIKGFKDEIAIYESFVKELEDIPSAEPKKVCIAQVHFDDEKLHEIVNEAVKKLKEEIEPKQGEWIDKGWHGDWQFETDGRGNCWHEYECSECGFHKKGSKSNYCPDCGVRMKGEGDEA